MSLKPKSVALWVAVPLLAMTMIACGDDEEIPVNPTTPPENCGNGKKDVGEACDDGNLDPRDACTTICVAAECGDGIVQRGVEDCDDGNQINNDSCNNDCEGPSCGNDVVETGEACDGGADCDDECKLTTCGDGVVQAPEQCDDGNADDSDTCTEKCLRGKCGDGVLQAGEQCDLGSSNADDGSCTTECENAECGDGFVRAGIEGCDDGNTDNDDDCTNDCKTPNCGDGIKQDEEICDDGNESNTDGCSNSCTPTTCGDGAKQTGEDCDDGNASNRDDCLNDCSTPECGDGIKHDQGTGKEECDDGEDNGPDPALCSTECTLNACGNGELDPGEECDDDNDVETDSCLNNCQFNSCGDGIAYLTESDSDNPNDLEECDDENDDNNDACIDTCVWNSCGDGFLYTQPYNTEYDGTDDGNIASNNPYPLELCDDGNTSNTDSCIRTVVPGGFICEFNTCGDGQVYSTVTDTNNPFPTEDCDDANGSNTDSCLNSCEWASCEDGFLYTTETIPANPNAADEECDDGNGSDTDGCVTGCLLAVCGDSFLYHGREECDDGGAAGGCPSPGTCELPDCGDGDVDAGEECDDGNPNDNDSCLSTCQWNACGDGIRYMATTNTSNPNPIEACDDGNGLDRDACIASCEWNSCGDGDAYTEITPYDDTIPTNCRAGFFGQACDVDLDRVALGDGEGFDCVPLGANPMDECENPYSTGEDCDDGAGSPDTDSCTSDCAFNGCGDGYVYTTLSDPQNPSELEQCDDAGTTAECTATCTNVTCGDGIISPLAGETCDPEAAPWEADDGEGCTACRVDTCGNGVVNETNPAGGAQPGDEECDDGNTVDTDACTNKCFFARCGDGIVQTGEDCDDGNTDPTDTCSNACEDADCGDGIRQAGEECDIGTPTPTLNGVLNDDGFDDTSGFCTNTCELQCFESPARPWAAVYEDETCVFVPEPATDDGTDGDYTDLPAYLTFVQAEAYCDDLGIGAHLVKIQGANVAENDAKNEFVQNLLDAIADDTGSDPYAVGPDAIPCPIDPILVIPIDNDGGNPALCTGPVPDQPYWIGLYDNHTTQPDPRGSWIWIGDETIVSGGNNGGSNPLWEPGEPNDADGNQATAGQEDCGVIIQTDDDMSGTATPGRWNDVSCTSTFRFVCEFPLEQAP